MNKKSLLFTLVFFTFLTVSFSKPVALNQAQKLAYIFLYGKVDNSMKSDFKLTLFKEVFDVTSKSKLYYIFNIVPKGFIIVTADDNLTPVVAYSFEDNYVENKNPVQEAWMNSQITLAFKNMIDDKANNNKWESLSAAISAKSTKGVTALCTTKWNQDNYYNFMCPADTNGPGGHAYAGCVATSMGQVMKYWNYPSTGNSGYAYQHIHPMYFNDYGVVEANFGATTYNWSNMPNQINSTNKIDVATLLFHCGVAVKMDYGPDGSGAQTESVPFALSHYFKYSNSARYIERAFTPTLRWDSLIIDQLEKGFPMVYSGSDVSAGHAWVVDGYQDSSYFHINWGWSGWNNGYYYFSNLNSGNGDFTNYQGAVIDIFPQDYVGVEEIESKTFNLYPNPARDYFVVDSMDGNFSVDIIDLNGQIVKREANHNLIEINDIENGFYFVKITNNNTQFVSKLLILK